MSSAEKTPVSLADLPPCPVETTLTLISDKWKILILRDLLLHGTMRFGDAEKVHRSRLSKSFNFPAPPDGTERSGQP